MKQAERIREQYHTELVKKEGSNKPKILSMLMNCTHKKALTGWKKGGDKDTPLYLRRKKRAVTGWEPQEVINLLRKGSKVNYFTQANLDENISPLAMFIRLKENENTKFNEWSRKIEDVAEQLDDNGEIFYAVELGKKPSMEIVTVSD